MKIFGVDPGYAIVGWGVLSYDNSKFLTVDYDAITTSSKEQFSKRLEIIYDELSYVLNVYKPECISIEKLFFSSNKKTAINVAQARGVVLLAAKKLNIPIFEYAPVEVKQAIAGYGRATKKQVMEMVKLTLNLKKIPKPDDVADALALAVAHAHCSFSKLFSLKENLWYTAFVESLFF